MEKKILDREHSVSKGGETFSSNSFFTTKENNPQDERVEPTGAANSEDFMDQSCCINV